MTDLEMFVATYKQFGIECIVYPVITFEGDYLEIVLGEPSLPPDEFVTKDPRLTDYIGFHSTITFTTAGKFITQGFYE